MPTIAEKRVFTARDDVVRALVASSMGVASVSLSGDIVGEFGIERRCDARDVAARGDAVAVAADEDVLVGDFAPTGHGPAVAVGVAGDGVLAAAPDGTVSVLPGDADATGGGDGADDRAAGADPAGDAWEPVGTVEDPRRIDGPLVAAADGVHRLREGSLEYAGLDDARDVSARGVPLAVTGEALYTLGNGWMRDLESTELDGDGDSVDEFRCVAADADGERAVAATGARVFERADATATEWVEHAEAGVVDCAVAGRHLVAVTDAGEARVHADGGWRGRTLGLPDVRAVAVPGGD
ncbi:HVO_0234 family beta-propeller protein [Halobaculum sp. EA56]|uniref:HVO_0234 family beta-propeller protein n=1 Tax=Halobaculum sp. EA56 TaxID=3421648 RepID=UPI003EB7236C